MWPSPTYTPSSLPSRYRPSGSLNSTNSSSFNYTPSSNYGNTRLGSSGLGITSSSRYTPTGSNITSSYSSTSRDPYLSTSTVPTYNINQSPYSPLATNNIQQSPDLYTSYNNPTSRLSPSPLASRLSPSRASPGPSTSSNYTPQNTYTRESSPNTQRQSSPLSTPKSKFFSRRNSSADLAIDRRGSIIDAGKRSDSISDPNAIPSVKDSWASGYLRKRREAQKEEFIEPITSLEKGVFAAKTGVSTISASSRISPAPITKVTVKEPPPAESVANQKEFMNRLLAAHSAVDELLSRRGLKSEDENKFLRHYEWVPVIEEELPEERFSPHAIRRRHQTVSPMRSVSSESDSGLSMESTSDNNESIEIDAGDCEFEDEGADEFCEISVVMSGTETAVEYNVKRVEKPKVVEVPVEIVKSKSTKKLIRQKLHIDEVIELHAKLQEKIVLPEPKSIKKLVRQNKTTEELELRVLKIEEVKSEVPLQIAFSKCAIAKCKPKIQGETFTEHFKLKKVEKVEEIKSIKVKGAKPSKVEEIKPIRVEEIKPIKIKEAKPSKVEEIKPEGKPIKIKEAKSSKVEEVPLQIAFSKCAISKCKQKCEGETFTEHIKLKPIPKPQQNQEKPKSTEIHLKKVVKIQEPTKLEDTKFPELKKQVKQEKQVDKLKKSDVKSEPEAQIKKPAKKLLKRQQTEPTLPTTRRQVGKLTIDESKNSATNLDDSKLSQLSKSSRNLLDSLSLMSMANRTTNAKFLSFDESKQRGLAEISVQHCSFYEVHKGLIEPKEKALKIHLRLTARVQTTALSTQKILPTNERTNRLFLRIFDRRDIIKEVQEERARRELSQSPKLPGKLKIAEFLPNKEVSPKRPLIFTDTSVKLLQEKLKRQQANAELQSLRGNLKRVPKARLVSAGKADVQEGQKKLPKRKIVKKIVKKSINPTVKIDNEVKVPKFDDIYLSKVESKSSLSLPIEKQQISQCPSSSSIASSGNRSSRSKSTFLNKKFMGNWERRIFEEFRRNRNIPVLHAIYRQIFCLKCKICPTLGTPRGPHRAHFVRRNAPHHRHQLGNLPPSDLLRLMAIFRPSAAQIARLSTKSHRPKQYNSTNGNLQNPFGVSLRRVNGRQRRPWIPYNQRNTKGFVPQWRQERND